MSIGLAGLAAWVRKAVILTADKSGGDPDTWPDQLSDTLEIDGVQPGGTCPARRPPILKGRSVQRDLDRTDEEVTQLILHNCHQMGETPQHARRMVERCLVNRRKPVLQVAPE